MRAPIANHIGIMIRDMDLMITQYVKRRLAPYQLAPEQNLIMLTLWDTEGMTPNELSERLNKDKAGITRMIDSLVHKGFVRRDTDRKDARSFRLFLTEAGRELGQRVIPVVDDISSVLLSGITEEETAALAGIFAKIGRNLIEINESNL